MTIRKHRISAANGPFGLPVFGILDTPWFGIAGFGLGNRLFTWARCLSTCSDQGWLPVVPTWRQLHPRRWLIGGLGKRPYHRQVRSTGLELTGHARRHVLLHAPRISETEANRTTVPKEHLVTFSGTVGHFETFNHNRELVIRAVDRLLDLGLNRPRPPYIAVHVRLGDFLPPSGNPGAQTNTRLPNDWYLGQVERARELWGRSLPVLLVSDGRPEELAPFLAMDNIHHRPGGSDIKDLAILAKSVGFIASCSTYSQWAAFLGGQPALWPDESWAPI